MLLAKQANKENIAPATKVAAPGVFGLGPVPAQLELLASEQAIISNVDVADAISRLTANTPPSPVVTAPSARVSAATSPVFSTMSTPSRSSASSPSSTPSTRLSPADGARSGAFRLQCLYLVVETYVTALHKQYLRDVLGTLLSGGTYTEYCDMHAGQKVMCISTFYSNQKIVVNAIARVVAARVDHNLAEAAKLDKVDTITDGSWGHRRNASTSSVEVFDCLTLRVLAFHVLLNEAERRVELPLVCFHLTHGSLYSRSKHGKSCRAIQTHPATRARPKMRKRKECKFATKRSKTPARRWTASSRTATEKQ
jgi:hypothetical protein